MAQAWAWAWVEAVAARELEGQNGNFARLRRGGARANGAAFCSRRRSLLISGRFWYFPAFVLLQRSRFFELPLVLVRLDHVARSIVNTNHSVV
jgi:hypothetical protein